MRREFEYLTWARVTLLVRPIKRFGFSWLFQEPPTLGKSIWQSVFVAVSISLLRGESGAGSIPRFISLKGNYSFPHHEFASSPRLIRPMGSGFVTIWRNLTFPSHFTLKFALFFLLISCCWSLLYSAPLSVHISPHGCAPFPWIGIWWLLLRIFWVCLLRIKGD